MSGDRVMLLIDADNVSVDVMAQAVQRLLDEHGALHVRRAYCTAETALKHQAVFKRLGIRPMVNLSAGKNCTDIALAVDALDLVLAERPDIVAIASSDSDFEPLVARLREKGCRVVGFGQQGKTGEDTEAVYDAFQTLVHQPAARKAAAKKKSAPAPAPTPAPTPAPAPAPLPKRNDKAAAITGAVPELAAGGFVPLNLVAEKLRAAKLLGKSASSTKLLRTLADHFELDPEKKPERVRLRGA